MTARKRDTIKRLTTGWTRRTLGSTRMAAELGGAVVKRAAGLSTGEDDHSLGASLADRMDGMKGLMMKLGQMVSYLEGALPPDAQRALRKLQAGGDPLEYAAIAAVIEQAFGCPIQDLFEAFDEEALAAASIGQVHRAVHSGASVAVKVQYPEIAKTMQVDLGNAERLGLLATLGTQVDRSVVVKELRERLREECDYLQEAANTTLFRALFADDPRVVIPEVLPSRCRTQVLTTRFIDGQSFYAFRDTASQAEKDRAGELIFEFVFRSIFSHASFNGDPHPGNYLFLPEGQICFLDFGCVRYFERAFVDAWKALARCVLEDRKADLPEAMHATGMIGSARYDFDYHWEVMQYLYRPFKTRDFRYTHDYVSKSYNVMVLKNPNQRKTAMPAEWVFTNRLQWGLNSILALLDASGDWPRIFSHWAYAPTMPTGKPAPLQPPVQAS